MLLKFFQSSLFEVVVLLPTLCEAIAWTNDLSIYHQWETLEYTQI